MKMLHHPYADEILKKRTLLIIQRLKKNSHAFYVRVNAEVGNFSCGKWSERVPMWGQGEGGLNNIINTSYLHGEMWALVLP